MEHGREFGLGDRQTRASESPHGVFLYRHCISGEQALQTTKSSIRESRLARVKKHVVGGICELRVDREEVGENLSRTRPAGARTAQMPLLLAAMPLVFVLGLPWLRSLLWCPSSVSCMFTYTAPSCAQPTQTSYQQGCAERAESSP